MVDTGREMRAMITKDSTTSHDTGPAAGPGPRSRNCNCGQQLDVCAREHCPRCGRSLNRR